MTLTQSFPVLNPAKIHPLFSYNNCVSLTSITIPASITSFDNFAFYGCSRLTAIDVNSANNYYSSVNGVLFNRKQTTLIRYPAGKATEYAIPSGVTSIGSYAFLDCSSLTSITIPDGVTSIGEWAFLGCTSLTFYAEVASKPYGWYSSWNDNRPVVWGCTLSTDKSYVVSFTKSANSISNPGAGNGISAPSRIGYTFGGWATTSGSTTVAYTAASIASVPNGTTLYAIWLTE